MITEFNLFEEARKSRVLLNGVLSTLVLFLMLYIGQIIGGIFFTIIGAIKVGSGVGTLELYEFSSKPMVALLACIFPILVCFLWVKLVEKRKVSSLGLKKDRFLIKFMKGFGIGFLMFSLVTLLMYSFGIITLKQGLSIGVRSIPSILVIIPGWIIQSSSEEILTRGWFMNVVGAKHKPIIGFIISSALFGFLHIFNPGVNILSIINIILVGFMFGLYVIYTQDLWGACGIHAAWNFSQGNIFGFKVSGLELNSDSLLKFSSNGHNLLTGGEFGPEASIFATIVISITIGILVFKLKQNQTEDNIA